MAGYRFKDMVGNGSATNNKAIDFVNPSKAFAWGPSYTNNGTIVRFLPTKDVNGELSPCRYSHETRDFGDWIRSYPAVRKIGEPDKDPVSFFLGDIGDPNFDEKMTPAWVLYNAMQNAINNRQEGRGWAGMLKGGKGRGAVVPKPSRVFVAPVLVVRQGDKQPYTPFFGLKERDKPVILTMSMSAGMAVINALDKELDNEAGERTLDLSDSPYCFDDIIDLQRGKYVALFPKKAGPPMDVQYNISPEYKAELLNDANNADYDGYNCAVFDSYNNCSADVSQIPVLRNRLISFEDVLHFPTVEEQARLIAARVQPDVIMYAWRDYPEWIPSEVRSRAVNAVSAAVPAEMSEVYPSAQTNPYVPPAPTASNPNPQPPVGQPSNLPPTQYPNQGAGATQPPLAPPPGATQPPLAPPPGATPPQSQVPPPSNAPQPAARPAGAMDWAKNNNPLSEIPQHQPPTVLPPQSENPEPPFDPTGTYDPIQNALDAGVNRDDANF